MSLAENRWCSSAYIPQVKEGAGQDAVSHLALASFRLCTQVYSFLVGLNFSLRFYLEPEGEGEAVEKVAYTPHDLDKEPPEFVETLEFLADLFTFRRTQLDAFLGKLKATLGSSGGDDEEEG